MKKGKAMKLVKALRYGGYKQGRTLLVDNEDRFCCLGVACNISKIDLDWKKREHTWSIGGSYASLPKAIQEEYGFFGDQGERRDGKAIIINTSNYPSLADANDDGVSFLAIARYIEKNYKEL